MVRYPDIRIGVVVSHDYGCTDVESIVSGDDGIIQTLCRMGFVADNIEVEVVTSERNIALATHFFAQYTDVDAVVVYADKITKSTLRHLENLQLQWNMPVDYLCADDLEDIRGFRGRLTIDVMVQMQIAMAANQPLDDDNVLDSAHVQKRRPIS